MLPLLPLTAWSYSGGLCFGAGHSGEIKHYVDRKLGSNLVLNLILKLLNLYLILGPARQLDLWLLRCQSGAIWGTYGDRPKNGSSIPVIGLARFCSRLLRRLRVGDCCSILVPIDCGINHKLRNPQTI